MLFAVVLFSSEVWGHNQKRKLKLALYSKNFRISVLSKIKEFKNLPESNCDALKFFGTNMV